MIAYAAIVAIQVAMIIDVLRNGANRFWIMALMFLPLASTSAYLIVEVLPRMKHNRHLRQAQAQIIEKLDPERELRAAREALDIAQTAANRMRLADALVARGAMARHCHSIATRSAPRGPTIAAARSWPAVCS